MVVLQLVESPSAELPSGKGRKPAKPLSYNLNGQKLGRKGRDTRDRILAATTELLAEPDMQITLSAVARRAGLGMTSLYNYFGDLSELLIASLEPVMATAEADYLGHLRQRWPDETLGQHCLEFTRDYYKFWQKHTRILHLRNSMSEGNNDRRMAEHRLNTGIPMVQLFTFQMDSDPEKTGSPAYSMATALFTGIDRLVAVRTTTEWSLPQNPTANPDMQNQLLAEARLLELAIRDGRAGLDFGA
jgi:AcrR family transcriptional regulator